MSQSGRTEILETREEREETCLFSTRRSLLEFETLFPRERSYYKRDLRPVSELKPTALITAVLLREQIVLPLLPEEESGPRSGARAQLDIPAVYVVKAVMRRAPRTARENCATTESARVVALIAAPQGNLWNFVYSGSIAGDFLSCDGPPTPVGFFLALSRAQGSEV